jgi:L-lactate dehydrogenase complex protein LldF
LRHIPFAFEPLREQGRAIKEAALSRLDELLLQFEAQVTANGGKVHWARDAAEARDVITRILKESGAKTGHQGQIHGDRGDRPQSASDRQRLDAD